MGRGSGGVAKGNPAKLSDSAAHNDNANMYEAILLRVRQNADTDSLVSDFRQRVKLYPTETLEYEHRRALNSLAYYENKKDFASTTTFKTLDKMELAQRQELMRRDPKKFDVDWYMSMVRTAKKRYQS